MDTDNRTWTGAGTLKKSSSRSSRVVKSTETTRQDRNRRWKNAQTCAECFAEDVNFLRDTANTKIGLIFNLETINSTKYAVAQK